jgi:hypothetical protein
MLADLKSAKVTDGLNVFFALLGSALVKATRKMLVKSTPGLGPIPQQQKNPPNC